MVTIVVCVVWALIATGAAVVLAMRDDANGRTLEERDAALRSMAAHRDELGGALERCKSERDRLYWLEWWMRNAVETPTGDPARGMFIRWAIAAHCAESFEALHRDLMRVASDAERSESERIAARHFAHELERKEHPWEVWKRETGKPPHNAALLRMAYVAALDGWPALLPQAR